MALYRSPLTATLWPSSFLKKYGPMIPPAHKAHQTFQRSTVYVLHQKPDITQLIVFPQNAITLSHHQYFPTTFFLDKGDNASQVTEIANGVYGADTVTANYVQFWFRQFRPGIFDVKDAPHTGRPIVENVDKITEIIEVDRQFSSRSIGQELKIDH
ncbi:histone-lysine N-methyltransferase SETMAR [Trichonephila clavipes]|nr:histone-lysine N-methyltransferase SETMAR [Trichonephila clavipes]